MKRSGFYFTEGMPLGDGRAPPGTAAPGSWKPYKIWSGDKWECEGCGATILCGFGSAPISVQHMEHFAAERVRLGADKYQVNDC